MKSMIQPKKETTLDQMIENLQDGDQIYVYNLYYLADSIRHLNELLDIVESRVASIISISEAQKRK